MALPLLVVVSGPAGSGTTTLAHTLARSIPCPAVCRDEIKEGMVHTAGGGYTPAPGDTLSYRTLDAFFGVIRFLIDAGVTHVAEAAFQHRLWEPGLRPLLERANVRIVHCRVDAAVARARIAARLDEVPARRSAHGDSSVLEPFDRWRPKFESFDRIALPVPTIEVDTTDGYDPGLDELVSFVNRS